MLLVLSKLMMTETWYEEFIVPSLKDINGTDLAIGDSVSIPATITSIIKDSEQYGRAVLQFKYGPTRALNTSTLNLIKQ